MNQYFQLSQRWPWYLMITGVAIIGASVWYANQLADQLLKIEENYVKIFSMTVQDVGDIGRENEDLSTELFILENNTTVPSILVSSEGEIIDALNWGEAEEDTVVMNGHVTWILDTVYLRKELDYLIEHGKPPVPIDGGDLMYFGTSRLIRQLRYFPAVQLLIIATVVALGAFGIIKTRRAEQNRVWVGMAKETAHQLGTPISAMLGWVEHMKLMYEDREDIQEIAGELEKDVERLSMVANRFSKIGAEPELNAINIYEELDKCRNYMEKRAPRKVCFDFPEAAAGEIPVAINPLLFDWVIENLLRNALDAMDGKGRIVGRVRELEDKVFIDISDTGKGIAPRDVRKVFDPGFTTKKRGWGLGLSLVKRIIEEYHRGKVAVSASEIGKGTTFTITLPRAMG